MKEIERTISEFAKVGSIAEKINWEECFKYALSSLGVENTSKFLLNNNDVKTAQNSSLGGNKNEIQAP